MKRFGSVLSLLFLICSVFADDQYGDGEQYPTAKLTVADSGPSESSASSRYALQVSGDHLQDYLKALKNVPESVYSNGAHIIADMDESALPESLSSSRYDSDQEGESRDQVDLRSLIPAIRLDRQNYNAELERIQDSEERPEEESRRRSLVYEHDEDNVRPDRPSFKLPTTRELLRDLLMRREDVAKADSPLSPVAAAAAQVMEDQISHVKEAIKEAKALQAAEASETFKGKVVEALKQKEAEERKQAEAPKEFATASTARVPEIDVVNFKPEEERPDKYRAQESENKFNTHDHYKAQEAAIKQSAQDETGASKKINSAELFMSRAQSELSKSLHYNQPTYERENRSDIIDMKTVRELLSTLIKQIENIQSAARTLTSVTAAPDYSYESNKKPNKVNQKGYNKQPQHREENGRERQKKRKLIPYDILDTYQPVEGPSYVPKKPKRQQKSERTVYLKPHEVMKLLSPDPYEHVEMPLRRNRPYSIGASTASVRRLPFPMRRGMYPNFYPGIAANVTCCNDKCATNFGFSLPAGYKKK